MVDRKTTTNIGPAPGAIPLQSASAASLAQVDFANTLSSAGRGLQRIGFYLLDINKEFKKAAQEADNTAVYANSINQATINFQNLFQERINQQVDEDGNPTFSTLQEDVAQIGRDVMEETLNTINNSEVRARFQQNFQSYTGNQQIASISIARNQQLSFINESVSSSVADLGTRAGSSTEEDRIFFENQARAILDSAVASGAMTPEQKFNAQDAFRKEVATAQVRNSINQDSAAALRTLTESSAQELGLTELERLSLQNEAQTALNRDQRALIGLEKEQTNYIRDQLKQFDRIIELGGQIPQESIDDITQIIVGTGMENELQRILTDAHVINEFTMNSPVIRQAILNELSSDPSLGLEELELNRKLTSIDNNLNNKMNNDLYSLAIEQGIVENPEPFNPDEDIKQQLADRLSSIGFVEHHYSKRTSGLTAEEIDGFQEAYINADFKRKSEMLGDVVGGMGTTALSFLEDLAIRGSTQTAAIGSLMLQGDTSTATSVLKGQDIISKQRDIIPSDYTEAETAALQNVLPFYSSPDQRDDTREMARAIYAARSFEMSDFSGKTNESRLEDAIAEVSNGGAVNFNKSNVEPPIKGMTSNQFKSWIRNISPEQIDELGGWRGFESINIPRLLRGSQLVTQGRGQYIVFLEAANGTSLPVINNNGDVFILDYNIIEDNQNSREQLQGPSKFEITERVKRFNLAR